MTRGRSFYAERIDHFMAADANAIIGQLSSRHVSIHQAAEAEQVHAWEREIEILKSCFTTLGPAISNWSILIETPLFRLGKRLDVVLLAGGIVCVIEFKIGASGYDATAKLQTERYAQSLRDFHEVSQKQLIIPILCAERAETRPFSVTVVDGVSDLVCANAKSLPVVLALVRDRSRPGNAIDSCTFDNSPYRPTPTIIEAAQELYAGHQISEIGRGDAIDVELQSTATLLQEIVRDAEIRGGRTICFVTGAPGAGKTLLGLDLALKSRSGTRPAALLSGNRPLVHVLTDALAADCTRRTGISKAATKYQAEAAIQNLLGYLKEHTDGAIPPENVIVFDEAQRAWDEDVGQELMGRPTSEPALFLNILSRLPWSCLVCLVGPGQEINRGEGGLPLWGAALASAASSGKPWRVIAAPQALDGGPDVAGAGLLSGTSNIPLAIYGDKRLHLSNAIRAYRNPQQSRWVALLLEGDIGGARAIAETMEAPPAVLTRSLVDAKTWLSYRRRGGRSVGLLASSGAVRLIGDGLPPTLRSNELAPIGHWFLKPYTDYRGAGALETPLSEYGCQGLELDYTGICWGGDLTWQGDAWVPRRMRAPRWQVIREREKQRFKLNAYRVLLTRARAGSVIFVPPGSADDPTRSPAEMDQITTTLTASGCVVI